MEKTPSRCSGLSTSDSLAPTFLRLALGVMIFPHGAQKLLGWFGGYGFAGTLHFFTADLHIPWIFALAAILVEFFGGILLILGLWTRLAAALVGINLLVAMFFGPIHQGFFMNWGGNQKGEGLEFFLLVFGIALALVIQGGGRCSVDRLLGRETPPATPEA